MATPFYDHDDKNPVKKNQYDNDDSFISIANMKPKRQENDQDKSDDESSGSDENMETDKKFKSVFISVKNLCSFNIYYYKHLSMNIYVYELNICFIHE